MHLSAQLVLAWLASYATAASNASVVIPTAPTLEYLYTAFVECKTSIYESQGPSGIRKAIPIVGGNFTGPRLSGKILNLGADWGLVDVQTGIFRADTRYNLQTDDGANIYIQTAGPKQVDGKLHLRLLFETGDKKYYWLNNIIAVGILENVQSTEDGTVLRIDAWNMASEYTSTTFINGTTA